MKKILPVVAHLVVLLIPSASFAQLARQNVILEHYTAVDCAYCGIFNPRFLDTISQNNDGSVHILSYHTSYFNGRDPMYSHNPTDILPREYYYNVAGIPNLVMQGGGKIPLSSVRWLTMDTSKTHGSPVRILVDKTVNGQIYNTNVEIQSVGSPPPGNWLLRVAVIQEKQSYSFAPGYSLETDFHHVFRRWVNSNGPDGEPINLPAKGDSKMLTYSFGDHPDWNGDMYVIAFLQNASSKKILNSGSSIDPRFELVNTSENIFQKRDVSGNLFTASLCNTGLDSATYILKVNANQPKDWTHEASLDGLVFSDSIVVVIPGQSSRSIELVVNPTQVVGVGSYQIIAREATGSEFQPQQLAFHVVGPITDVVISNKSIPEYDFQYDFTDTYLLGLKSAGNESHSAVNLRTFIQGRKAGAFDELNNIYFYQFGSPAISGELVEILADFMDMGGNLLVASNSLGFSNHVGAGGVGGVEQAQFFYEHYLHAQYIDLLELNHPRPRIYWNDFDPIFGGIYSTPSVKGPEGYEFYTKVEQIKPVPGSPARPFAFYDLQRTQIAGLRAETAHYKVVFLATGVERLSNPVAQTEFIRLAHDWFYGKKSDTPFDDLYFTAFPNPTINNLHIRLVQPFPTAGELEIYNMGGQMIHAEPIPVSNYIHTVNVSSFPTGAYIYRIYRDGEVVQKQSFLKR